MSVYGCNYVWVFLLRVYLCMGMPVYVCVCVWIFLCMDMLMYGYVCVWVCLYMGESVYGCLFV